MTTRTAEASTVHQPFGKPGGPGLFGIKGQQLPAYVQHVAHELVKKGHPRSQAIQMAIGIIKNWARGGNGVKPDVVAAAQKALAEWEAAKAKAHALSNRQEAIELAANNWAKWDQQHGRDAQYGGQQAKDGQGLSKESKAAIASAYQNKAKKDGEKAAKQAANNKKKADKKAAADKVRAAKKAASAKAAADRKAAAQTSKDNNDALKQALADKKAGRPLTTQQQKRLRDAAAAQQARTARLRTLSNEAVELANAPKPGQRYRHGWILIGGAGDQAKLPKGHPDKRDGTLPTYRESFTVQQAALGGNADRRANEIVKAVESGEMHPKTAHSLGNVLHSKGKTAEAEKVFKVTRPKLQATPKEARAGAKKAAADRLKARKKAATKK